MGYKIGIDVGGTFTDFLLVDDEGSVMIFKTPSTPQNPSLGVINGFKEMSLTQKITLQQFLCQVDVIVHGTTITTNAVLTKNFVKTGFITTKGFRDYLATRRGLKGSVYNPKESPPEPIVPRKLRQTIEERVDCEGKIFIPLKEKDVFSAVEVFRKENVEAVAVNFMFSFANPVHEHKVAQILGKKLPDAYVCISSDVLPQVRMYERASTTVLNACLGPVLRRYIMSLLKIFSDDNFAGILLIMQSNGGMMAPEMAMDLAVNTLLSGPAGAPKAGVFFGDLHNVRDFITIDMGGTSFDACLVINGQPEVTGESEINHYRVATQAIAIQTIGAGGGSIAQLDDRGILCVGPQSAGSSPGPVCYGMSGTEPTVTDANLALGLINPDFFLGGRMKIYPEKAEESIEKKIAHPLELGLLDAAYGIYMVVNSSMAQGVRLASAEKGYDP
ncbi:MAG: hydantoinase/oxoprolinase family protein, partial [Desulfatiglandales bacterium]|nr:hydantoinase/oxoprolinase family protein [Desulfatiglandales bacterium]